MLTADTIADAAQLHVGHKGTPGNYVGLIKCGKQVIWTCPHRHHNRDADTTYNTAARACAGRVLTALNDIERAQLHLRTLYTATPVFHTEQQAREWRIAIDRQEWAVATATEILDARIAK